MECLVETALGNNSSEQQRTGCNSMNMKYKRKHYLILAVAVVLGVGVLFRLSGRKAHASPSAELNAPTAAVVMVQRKPIANTITSTRFMSTSATA
jgi:hypothetical protein